MSACAACKLMRRKCTNECIFAPYFPQAEADKFSSVHKVFGNSNVAKLLNDVEEAQRKEAARSLVYEANARRCDPVYGCMGQVSFLLYQLEQAETELLNAKRELLATQKILSDYIGHSAISPIQSPGNYISQYHNPPGSAVMPYNMQQAQIMGGLPSNVASPGPTVLQQQLQCQHNPSGSAVMPYNMQQAQMMGRLPSNVASPGPTVQQQLQCQHNPSGSAVMPYNMQQAQMMGRLPSNVARPGPMVLQQPQYQHIIEAKQTEAAVRIYQQQQQAGQQQSEQLLMYDAASQILAGGRFNQIRVSEAMAPALALSSFGGPYQIQQNTQAHPHLHQHHHQLQAQQLLLEQQQQQQNLALEQPLQVDPQQQQQLEHHRDGSEEEV